MTPATSESWPPGLLAEPCLIQVLAPRPPAVTPITFLYPTIFLFPKGAEYICTAATAGLTAASGLVLEVQKVKQN